MRGRQLHTRHHSPRKGHVCAEDTSGRVTLDNTERYNNYAKYGKARIKKKWRFPLSAVPIAACLLCLLFYLVIIAIFGSKRGGRASETSAVKSSLRQFYKKYSQQNNDRRPENPYHALGSDTKRTSRTPQTVNLASWSDQKDSWTIGEKFVGKSADYGGIEYHSLHPLLHVFQREIGEDESAAFDPHPAFDPLHALVKTRGHPRYIISDGMPMKKAVQDASYDELLNFYDDDNVEVFPKANDGKTQKPRACRRPEFETLYFPTCNSFHEIDLGRPYDDPEEMLKSRPENQLAKTRYHSAGYYRDVWIVEDNPWIWPSQFLKERESRPKDKLGVLDEKGTADLVAKAYRTMVLKTLRNKHKMDTESFEEIRLEAIIMERLTKSPRIMDLYGHCGFSVTAEVVPIEFEERVVFGEGYAEPKNVEERNKNGIRPYNNFTATEKLGIALEMAESIADLHGFKDGVIVHDDIQLCQWMTKNDGKLKLGDFNRATIMQWDEINEEYCMFNNGHAFGNYRAPEEFAVINLNEQIDTFSFGNNIYALLTGLWNFYDIDDDATVHEKLIDGELAYIDPRYKRRSYEESKLVELMQKCWAYEPDERISIFDAVQFLRQAIKDKP